MLQQIEEWSINVVTSMLTDTCVYVQYWSVLWRVSTINGRAASCSSKSPFSTIMAMLTLYFAFNTLLQQEEPGTGF